MTENGIGLVDYLAPNGLCNDVERVALIDRHLDALADSVTQGAKVEAYFAWTLMDTSNGPTAARCGTGSSVPTTRGMAHPKASAQRYRSRIAVERGGRSAHSDRREGATA